MKFDVTRVYTTFSVDEVKLGSKGYFADTKDSLIDRVQSEDKSYYSKMIKRNESDLEFPFTSGMINSAYRYFYLVEEPSPKRSCTMEEFLEMLKKQGLPMVKSVDENLYFTVSSISSSGAFVDIEYPYERLCECFTLLDGTPLWVEE